MRNGILTSNSAGNRGPGLANLTNISPWSLSVAASAIDRKFFTEVQLGNDKIYEGISINTFDLKNEMYPIIYGRDAPNTTAGFEGSSSRYCDPGTLDQNLVKGKFVLCDFLSDGEGAFLASAVGTVIKASGRSDVAFSFPLPASSLGIEDGSNVYFYINSTRYRRKISQIRGYAFLIYGQTNGHRLSKITSNPTNNPNVHILYMYRSPTATILRTKERKDAFAPYIPSLSSRGPNVATSNILKPDLAAPGLNILAAWSPIAPISEVGGDNRKLAFNIVSGTSMACPHATGAAAYFKSLHPKWSPAAIKSALMTTADPMSAGKNPEAELAYGAGNINPSKAPNPGLIYDIDAADYIKFLFGQGYNTKSLQLVSGDNSSCSDATNGTVNDLNYPSFALSTPPLRSINRVFNRIVTNVGSPTSTYKAILTSPLGLTIKVTPSILSFTSLGQKLSYTLTIEGTIDKFIVSASVTWDDCTFQVRSPIAVFVP